MNIWKARDIFCHWPSMNRTLFVKPAHGSCLSSAYLAINPTYFPRQVSPLTFQLSIIGSKSARGFGIHIHLQMVVCIQKSKANARRSPQYHPGQKVWLSTRDCHRISHTLGTRFLQTLLIT